MNMTQEKNISLLLVRTAVAEDHDVINRLYMSVKGRGFCIWNDEYPEEEDIDVDIAKGNLLVLTNGAEIVGALSIIDETEWDELGVCGSCRFDRACLYRSSVAGPWIERHVASRVGADSDIERMQGDSPACGADASSRHQDVSQCGV